MTDNQDPLQTLNMLKNPEGQPATSPNEPTTEELEAQRQAAVAERIKAQARIQELEGQKNAQDKEEIAQLREELPGVIEGDVAIGGEVKDDGGSSSNNQAEDKLPQVEQLRRLE